MKIDQKTKQYIKQNAISLIHLLDKDEDLSYNDLGNYISKLKICISSLEIVVKELTERRDEMLKK